MSHPFPPENPPGDKAKYRQFLIDHGLDPNLNPDGLRRALEEKNEPEREQFAKHWDDFQAAQ